MKILKEISKQKIVKIMNNINKKTNKKYNQSLENKHFTKL